MKMQNIDQTGLPFLVTLNPPCTPEHTVLKWTTSHPVPSVAASKASLELDHIQGKRGIWFCGAYQGTPFSFGKTLMHMVSLYLKKQNDLLPIRISLFHFGACLYRNLVTVLVLNLS